MRDIVNFPQIDYEKLEDVKSLIDDIAENIGDCNDELKALENITGKQHTAMEFAEYWGWTDLDVLAETTLTPEPPCVRDLTQSEIEELVTIIRDSLMEGDDAKGEYYVELLHRSLPLANVMNFVMSDDAVAVTADKMIKAAKSSIILL